MTEQNLIKQLNDKVRRLHIRIKTLEELIERTQGTPVEQAIYNQKAFIRAQNKAARKQLQRGIRVSNKRNKPKRGPKEQKDLQVSWEERYLHPKWRSRAQEIKRRDNHKCTNCGSPEALEVHHKIYQPGFEVWEYSGEYLTTWCRTCHKSFHDIHPGKTLVNYGTSIQRYTPNSLPKI